MKPPGRSGTVIQRCLSAIAVLTAALVFSAACARSQSQPASNPAVIRPPPLLSTATPASQSANAFSRDTAQVTGVTADRAGDCAAIRGTSYLSEFERVWYLSNCQPVPGTPTRTPTPTKGPPPGCTTLGAVSNPNPGRNTDVTVMAKLSCNGAKVEAVSMAVSAKYKNSTATCSALTDAGGVAGCPIPVGNAPTGALVKVTACFSYDRREYCGATGFTPR
jgi:hypothetical protein